MPSSAEKGTRPLANNIATYGLTLNITIKKTLIVILFITIIIIYAYVFWVEIKERYDNLKEYLNTTKPQERDSREILQRIVKFNDWFDLLDALSK